MNRQALLQRTLRDHSDRGRTSANKAVSDTDVSARAIPSAGQIQITKDSQSILLSVEETATAALFMNTEVPEARLLKKERKHAMVMGDQGGRAQFRTMLIYQVPATHQNTLKMIDLGNRIRQQYGTQIRATNEATRTHFYTHQKLAADTARETANIKQGPVLPVTPAPAADDRETEQTGAPLPVLGVGVKHTPKRPKPARRIEETQANIQIMTGHTEATARQATALRIRAPRDPNEENVLANGFSNEGLHELMLSQPGAQYIKRRKGRGKTPPRSGYYRVPISETTPALLKRLMSQYGLTVEERAPTLNTRTIDAIKDRLAVLQMSYQLSNQDDLPESAHTTLVAPEGLDYLPYQKAGIAYALKLGNALIADEPGLGKTIQAIGVSNALPQTCRILIVVPASLKINWKREFEKWDTKGLSVGRVVDGRPDSWPDTDVVVINFDLIEKHYNRLTDQPWDMLVIDEAHALKNEDAKRTQTILGHGSGTKRVPGIPANRKLFLTGTPILNRPAEIWPLAHALDPDFFSDKMRFQIRYCNAHKTEYGWNAKGASNLGELNRQLRARIMVRRRKNQVLKDLPPKTRQIIELDQPVLAAHNDAFSKLKAANEVLYQLYEQRRTLADAYRNAPDQSAEAKERYRQQAKGLAREARTAFWQMSKVRKETALAKVPQVMDLIKTTLDNGKLILFCHHSEVVDAYRDALNTHFRKQAGRKGTPAELAVITGKTPNAKRQDEVDRFQQDKNCQVFIGTIGAAGTGWTLTEASTVLFAELDWVPGNMNQAEDRAHRIGQTDHVLVYHTAVEGSIDTQMIRRLVEKQKTIDEALEVDGTTDLSQISMGKARTAEEAFADWLQALAEDANRSASERNDDTLILDDTLAAQADAAADAELELDKETLDALAAHDTDDINQLNYLH